MRSARGRARPVCHIFCVLSLSKVVGDAIGCIVSVTTALHRPAQQGVTQKRHGGKQQSERSSLNSVYLPLALARDLD